MKKLLSLLISLLVVMTSVFAFGCNPKGELTDINADTFYNISVKEIAGERATATLSATSVVHGEGVQIKVYPADGTYSLYELRINGGLVDLSSIVYETYQGQSYYAYSISSVTTDVEFEVKLSKMDVIVHFDGSSETFEDIHASFNSYYGTLPTPVEDNKRFIGWFDQNNNKVTSETPVRAVDSVTLTAKFEDLTETEKGKLVPLAITSAYYDSAATKYGVVWHNDTVPSAPAVMVSKNADFSDSKTFYATSERLTLGKYVNAAVVEDLDYETTYYAKIGDVSIPESERSTYWSKTFTFTTRKENVDKVNFFFMNSSVQPYLNKYMNFADNGVGNANGKITDTYWSYVMKEATQRFEDADFIAHGGNFVSHNVEVDMWREMLGSVEDYLFNLPIMGVSNKYELDRFQTMANPSPIIKNMISKMFNIDTPNDGVSEVGRYYSFDYGPMHFITVRCTDLYRTSDINMAIGETKMSDAQRAWIKDDLRAAKQNPNIKWTVLMMTESPVDPDDENLTQVTTKTRTNIQEYVAKEVGLLCEQCGVDLVLSTSPRSYSLVASNPLLCDPDYFTMYPATFTTSEDTVDGDTVTKYEQNDANRGTIYYQTGSVGAVYGNAYASGEASDTILRKKLSGAAGCIQGVNASLSMYSYVEIDNNKLVLRTYGVDVAGVATALFDNPTSDLSDFGYYLDGIELVK